MGKEELGINDWGFTGVWSLGLGLSVVPHGDEVKPLVGMLADDGFEGTHNLLGELLASITVAQAGALVGNWGQDVSAVTTGGSQHIHRQDDAAGCAGEFRRGDRGGEWPAK